MKSRISLLLLILALAASSTLTAHASGCTQPDDEGGLGPKPARPDIPSLSALAWFSPASPRRPMTAWEIPRYSMPLV